MRGVLVILFLFCIVCDINGQHLNAFSFIGNKALISDQIESSNIQIADSNSLRFEVQIENYYHVKDLERYQFGLLKNFSNHLIKGNYIYINENVFERHIINSGIQKRLSKRLITNVSLGGQIQKYRSTEANLFFGFSFNYQLSNELFFHSVLNNLNYEGNVGETNFKTGIVYRYNENLGLFAQMNKEGIYSYRIGVSIIHSRFKAQVIHNIIQESIDLSFRITLSNYSLALEYSRHPILNQNIALFLNFNL